MSFYFIKFVKITKRNVEKENFNEESIIFIEHYAVKTQTNIIKNKTNIYINKKNKKENSVEQTRKN